MRAVPPAGAAAGPGGRKRRRNAEITCRYCGGRYMAHSSRTISCDGPVCRRQRLIESGKKSNMREKAERREVYPDRYWREGMR